MDRQVSFIAEYLKKFGLYKNTIIIITADHGEEMGGHCWYFNHVIDITPTLCDILKIEKPKMFEGRSLLSAIREEVICIPLTKELDEEGKQALKSLGYLQ